MCLMPQSVKAQYFPQTQTLNATDIEGKTIEESGQATHHSLVWTTSGTPSKCTLEITTSDDGDTFIPVGKGDCRSNGTYSVNGPKAKYVQIHLSEIGGGNSPSVVYSYVGAGPAADLWTKLDALRSIEAYKHGITFINKCPGSVLDQLPTLTDEDFQLYKQQFGASLDIAASFGDTGANGIPSAQNSIQTEALGQIEFETEHYGFNWQTCIGDKQEHTEPDGSKGRKWSYWRPTFSLGGSVGLRPTLVLENLTSTTKTITNPGLRPMFQDAFGWSLGPKFNWVTSHSSQFAAFGTLGENYLVSQVTSFKQGDDTVTATPISNSVGQSALFWEAGIEWKLLSTDIVNAYINKTDVLDPPFAFSTGYRQDGRFRRAGDLPATVESPEAYYFFRFNVGLNKILHWGTDEVKPGNGYTFKFGVDYERPVRAGSMPTATRYYVSANIDLMQVFKPSQKTPTGQQPPPPPAVRATIQ
jgi:hypothetical protein